MADSSAGDEPNPFSFRTFVQQGPPSTAPPASSFKAKGKKTPAVLNSNDDGFDDGFSDGADASSENPFSFKAFVKSDSAPLLHTLPPVEVDGDLPSVEAFAAPQSKRASVRTSSKTAPNLDTPFPEVADPELVRLEVDALRKKNKRSLKAIGDLEARLAFAEANTERIKSEAEEANARADAAERKVSSLERMIKTLRAKEVEDTAALDSMVHAIEKNLEITTVRALDAERTAAALRVERDALAQRAQAAEDAARDLASQCDASLNALREKSAYASAQLMKLSVDGDAAVKVLVRNVETMRLAADVLASMDRTETRS
eukprot:Opistho-2@43383